MLDWTRYLESISREYAQWWRVYTFTDVVGEVPQPEGDRASEVPLLDLGLMVETRVPSEKGTPDGERFGEEKKVERLGVLEGLRKYASEHVLLVGRPGSGKSTALLRMLLEEAESDTIPILVELRYWQTSTLDLIRRFLLRHDITLSRNEIEAQLAQGRFLLLIDGINELPSEAARRNVKAFRQDYPRTPMVFTARELGLGGDLEITRRLEMQPLSDGQMRQFVLRYLPEQGEEMWGQMGDRLRQLGETPLLLWMLCSMFGQLGDIPNSLGLVFRRFTALYGEKLKEDVAAESRRWWPMLLRQLAWVMTEGDEPTEILVAIPKARAEAALVECLRDKVAYPEARAEEWLEELLRYHLIQLRADAQIEFRHQLIQEYYAAEGLLQRVPEMTDEELQRRYLNYLKWTEPVALMLELVADEALAVRMVERALEVDLRFGARLAGAAQPRFQEETVKAVCDLTISAPTRYLLLSATKSEESAAGLLEALKDGNFNVRRRATDALVKISSEEAVAGILEALKDDDFSVRCRAAAVSGEIKSEEVVAGLLEALKSDDSNVRRRAAAVSGEIKSKEAVAGLLEALKSDDSNVRRRAADALGKFSSKEAVAGLLEALKDDDVCVHSIATYALGKIKSKEAVAGLLEALKNDDFSVRRRAADALMIIKSNGTVADLLEVLKDDDFSVRRRVANASGKIKSEGMVAGLPEVLKDDDSDARCKAADALREIKSEEAVIGLLGVLKGEDSSARRRAADALVRIKSEGAVTSLLEVLKDDDFYVRRRAADGLEAIASPKSLSRLHKLLLETGDPKLIDTIAKIQEKCRFYRFYPNDKYQNSDRLMTIQPDVFLAHHSKDRSLILQLYSKLKAQNIKPWLDVEDMVAGDRFQGAIQQAIAQVKAAAICIGPNGLGRWQDEELDALIDQCVKRKIRVIPVLLPGVEAIPENLLFLGGRHAVSFSSINDTKALGKLIEGITQPVTVNP